MQHSRLVLAAFIAASPAAVLASALDTRQGTRCPGGKTGILSPVSGQVIDTYADFQLVFCSSVKDPANTIQLNVGAQSGNLIAPNVNPSYGKVYNTTLQIYPGEESDTLFVYETKLDKNGKATLNRFTVPIQVQYAEYRK